MVAATRETILVVDDESDIVEVLRYNLEREGYVVLEAHDGETALALARARRPDVVLLDIMLPGRDGYSVAKALQSAAETRDIATIMISARDDPIDVVCGLELGADDYVVKPFRVREVLARVKAVLRRSHRSESETESGVIRHGPLVVDHERFVAMVEGLEIHLTLTEFKILSTLASSPGKVFDRLTLLERVQGDIYVDERTVDVHIRAIRKKLGAHRDIVETVRGVGYRIVALRSVSTAPRR